MRLAIIALILVLSGCIQPQPGENETGPEPSPLSPDGAYPPEPSAGASPPAEPAPGEAAVREYKNLEFAYEGRPILLDLYVPESDRPVPLAILIHGGGWAAGSKEECPGGQKAIERLASEGIAVACIDYRLSTEAKFPAQIEDVKSAIRWLRSNSAAYNLDKDRFGAWGISAGAHLAALAGTSGDEFQGEPQNVSTELQAVVDWYGPTDFMDSVGMGPPPDIPEKNRTAAEIEQEVIINEEWAATYLIGGPLAGNEGKARQADPIAYVTPDDPPFLIIHGTADGTVPVNQSRKLAAALEGAGVNVTYIEVEGAGHGFQPETEYFEKTMEYLAGQLGG
ncbi:MAG: alpha/beta hydrolase [Candidatus Micrarchaeota archaeon]